MNAGPIAQSENADVALKAMQSECWAYYTFGKCKCGYKNNEKLMLGLSHNLKMQMLL